MNRIKEIKASISQGLEDILAKAKEADEINYDRLPDYVLEVPREKNHGDFATNIAMLMAKEARMAPRKIAELIAARFMNNPYVQRVEVAGPGFINFYLNESWLYEALPEALAMGTSYGCTNHGASEKVQVEFVSANPTGLLHMGNARGAAIGDSLAALLEAAGYDVQREFYINDAGNQIDKFAISLEARYLELLGEEVVFPDDGYHGEDIKDTMKSFIAASKENYQEMDPEERRKIFVDYALQKKIADIKSTLADFGVKYDVWFSEKTLHEDGSIDKIVEELKEKKYLREEEGALWFDAGKDEVKSEVVVRSNGVPTYYAADIAYHKNKFERGFSQVIDIWGADHHGHVARMKDALEAISYDPDRLTVILMQLVHLFQNGEKMRMSKRTGTYVTLSELIEEVGKDAARYFFVMRSPDSHLDFDMDLAKQETSDNPVFYVQYAHARIRSILRQAEEMGYELPAFEKVDFTLLKEASEKELLRKIMDLPEEIQYAADQMAPHKMTTYVHDLAALFHGFYTNCRVLIPETELRQARLYLIKATAICIKNVLTMIGVSAPEKM